MTYSTYAVSKFKEIYEILVITYYFKICQKKEIFIFLALLE